MFLLNHVEPDKAEGAVAEAYAVFPPGMPPAAPLIMMSASPELARLQSKIIGYYIGHPTLDMGTLSMIRYLAAAEVGYDFCVGFNSHLLQLAGGMTPDELKVLRETPEKMDLEAPQKALILFALKVLRTPEQVQAADIDALHGLGWKDVEIFDAAFHATSMIGVSKVFKAFVK